MWLIDASQINVGGAVAILEMVLGELVQQQIPTILIKDKRLTKPIPSSITVIEPSNPILKRSKVYQSILKQYSIDRVVSLISIPPPFHIDVPVHTYFHNVNLLKSANIANASLSYQISQRLKNSYISAKLGNTDYYTFQSALIQADFLQDFDFPSQQCNIYPCYKEEEILAIQARNFDKVKDSFIYISVDYPHKNHKRLFDAWGILQSKGYTPRLTVSVPRANQELSDIISKLNAQGCQIENIGVVDYQTCLTHTAKAEYCIFPSMSESLGLGLVESHLLGNKVIGTDLPYTYQAVTPSVTFDPTDTESIVEAVIAALENDLPPTHLKMANALKAWIQFIKNSHI